MVGQLIEIVGNTLSTCLAWFWLILISIDGLEWVIAALIFVFVVALLLMPLRGGRSIDTSPFSDFTVAPVNRRLSHRVPFNTRGKERRLETEKGLVVRDWR